MGAEREREKSGWDGGKRKVGKRLEQERISEEGRVRPWSLTHANDSTGRFGNHTSSRCVTISSRMEKRMYLLKAQTRLRT